MIKFIKKILSFLFFPFIWLFRKIKGRPKKKEFYIHDIEALKEANILIKGISIQRTDKEGLKYSILTYGNKPDQKEKDSLKPKDFEEEKKDAD